MALPQKVIEQLGREPVKTPGWSTRILMVASTIFFLSLTVYSGVRFGYRPYLESKLAEVRDKITALGQKIPVADQEKIINFYSQLANVKILLDRQRLASALLPWFERHTHINVYLTSFSTDIAAGTVSVSARARTVDDLAQQLVSLENLPELKRIEFTGTTLGEDKFWNFTLGLTFVQEFLPNPEKFSTPSSE